MYTFKFNYEFKLTKTDIKKEKKISGKNGRQIHVLLNVFRDQ